MQSIVAQSITRERIPRLKQMLCQHTCTRNSLFIHVRCTQLTANAASINGRTQDVKEAGEYFDRRIKFLQETIDSLGDALKMKKAAYAGMSLAHLYGLGGRAMCVVLWPPIHESTTSTSPIAYLWELVALYMSEQWAAIARARPAISQKQHSFPTLT